MEDNRYKIGNRIINGVVIVDGAGNVVSSFGGTVSTIGIGNGNKDVTSAGTAEAIASSTACVNALIQAKDSNAGIIFVGGSTVSSADGVKLYPGESIAYGIRNLQEIYIDSSVSGDGVVFTYTA